MAQPWEKDVVVQRPGFVPITGPRGPNVGTGYAAPGAPAVSYVPGSGEDPAVIARNARINAGIQLGSSIAADNARTQNDLRADAIKRQRDQQKPGGGQAFEPTTTLRKELEAQPSVKAYKQAIQAYSSAMQAADTAAGDLNIVYSYAKTLDPDSVVREGEQAAVANLGAIPDQVAGLISKQMGEGRLRPELRRSILNEIRTRVSDYNRSYTAERARFRDLATKQGIDPALVVGPHIGDAYAKIENKFWRGDENLDAATFNRRQADAAARGEFYNPGGLNGSGGGPSGGGPTDRSLATGQFRTELDTNTNAMVDRMIRQGMSADQINAVIGANRVDDANVKAAQEVLRKFPDYQGGFAVSTKEVPNNLLSRAAGSQAGAAIGSTVDGFLGGLTDEISAVPTALATGRPYGEVLAELDANKQGSFAANPGTSMIGSTIGAIGGLATGANLLRSTALASGLGRTAPYVGSIAQGAITGAGQNNDNRAMGGLIGGAAGALGYGAGELASIPVGAALRTAPGRATLETAQRLPLVGRALGNGLPPPVQAPSSAYSSLAAASQKAGADGIRSQLDEAARLGIPMSLADTAPQLTSLGGASVRRSPTAAQLAETNLTARGLGQIDRLRRGVEGDLGPVANIPQLSADLMSQARTAASPLYDAAYAAPGASSVQLDDLVNRPLSMVPGLSRARAIAAEEGRDPTSLGFDLSPQGEVMLNRVPSFQTLDYVKRGLDDILEPHRDQLTGRLALNESTRAINNTKNTLLSRMDEVNPAYAQARQTYAGPTSARDALARGQDAFGLTPDELRFQVGNQSPEHLSQMQLGYRSALMNRANNVRDVSNPWEATLGNPNARARVDALYPGNPGNATLFRRAEIERQLARTNNSVLGNSKTAERGIADEAFKGSAWPAIGADAVTALSGGLPTASAARAIGGSKIKDALTLGATRRAEAKAEDLAPLLFNTDPAAAAASLDDILSQVQSYANYTRQTRPKRLGMFGSGFATTGASRF